MNIQKEGYTHIKIKLTEDGKYITLIYLVKNSSQAAFDRAVKD
jgi:outer membrane biosynthesis protein TonB